MTTRYNVVIWIQNENDVFAAFIQRVINSNLAKKKFCFQPGSNRRPSACKADVITTTLWKH